MSDKALFHVSSYVNTQNCRYWTPNNPHELHQRLLHSAKVTVWCAVSSHGIYWSLFLLEWGEASSHYECTVVQSHPGNISAPWVTHRDCRSVLNNMVVTYKVSYSNNNDWDEFSWMWNTPDSVNKIFPLCLKKLFHLKKSGVFDASCIFIAPWNSAANQQDIHSTLFWIHQYRWL